MLEFIAVSKNTILDTSYLLLYKICIFINIISV